MVRPKLPELIVGVLAAVLLVGSVVGLTRTRESAGPATPVEEAAPGEAVTAIEIVDFTFGPKEATVAVGDTLTWTNVDSAVHTVTGKENELLLSDDLAQDATYEVTFEEAGTFEYMCKFHPNMLGTITVEG
ncbi:MAG: cupredoxin domain-containing protein [Acidimicrobiales bacterium]